MRQGLQNRFLGPFTGGTQQPVVLHEPWCRNGAQGECRRTDEVPSGAYTCDFHLEGRVLND